MVFYLFQDHIFNMERKCSCIAQFLSDDYFKQIDMKKKTQEMKQNTKY